MSKISTSDLILIADRAANQYMLISDAIDSANTGTSYSEIVTATDNIDLEVPTIGDYDLVDNNFTVGFAARWGTPLPLVIYGMERHFLRPDGSGGILQAGGWDGYLADEDIRVSEWFDDLFYAVKSCHLLAINVFSEGTDLFGSVSVNGSGVTSFTDGISYGNGSELVKAGSGSWAATQLKVKVINIGANNVSLSLRVKNKDNELVTKTVVITGNSPVGTFFDIGSNSDRYLDVTNIELVEGSLWTSGDSFEVYNKKERDITA